MIPKRIIIALSVAILGLTSPATAQDTPPVDLCGWFAALDFNQPQTHYSKELTRMCRQGHMQSELAELRRITIEIQMQRFIASREKRQLIGNDVSVSRTGFYLIAQRLGIFRTG